MLLLKNPTSHRKDKRRLKKVDKEGKQRLIDPQVLQDNAHIGMLNAVICLTEVHRKKSPYNVMLPSPPRAPNVVKNRPPLEKMPFAPSG